MLISALGSALGSENPMNLKARKSVCVLLIDGLGISNLKSAGGHASFLNSRMSQSISCYFPATTSTSLTGLATALQPSETGFIGYQIYHKENRQSMNLLSGWIDYAAGATFQKQLTVSELAIQKDMEFHVVSHPAYEESGLTGATMRGAVFHGRSDIKARFEHALELLSQPQSKVIFLYVPELDQVAHQFGSESSKWLEGLETVDSLVRNLSENIPRNTGLIITADHGVIDIPESNHLYLDEVLPKEKLNFVGGDTRGLFLYLVDPAETAAVQQLLMATYSESCWVLKPDDLINAGYWKQSQSSAATEPDLVLLARKKVALYHRGFAKKKSLLMKGHHGSITAEELTVPLIKVNF